MNHGGALRVRAESLHHVPSQVVLRCAQVLAVAVVAATGGTIVGIFSREWLGPRGSPLLAVGGLGANGQSPQVLLAGGPHTIAPRGAWVY